MYHTNSMCLTFMCSTTIHRISCTFGVRVRILSPFLVFLSFFFGLVLAESGAVHLRIELQLFGRCEFRL